MAAKISSKSLAVLKYIAQGHNYEQILSAYPNLTYLDIFNAAAEAVKILEMDTSDTYSVIEVRETYPRAYEKWTEAEDEELKVLFNQGMKPTDIAEKLQRQLGAIQSRLRKLGLVVE